jgi:hypothetical protein
LTPEPGVELAGYGYYLGRTWDRVRDDLNVTAVVFDDGTNAVAVASLDILYADADFADQVRQRVSDLTDMTPADVMIACTHSHNAPTCAAIEGAGVVDPTFRSRAVEHTVEAVATAWNRRQEATLHVGRADFDELIFNRTRTDGPTDGRIIVVRADARDGSPLAILVNYAAHPTVMADLGRANVSRDYPGQVLDGLELRFRPAFGAFLQGACGDVNFERHFENPDKCREPGIALLAATTEAVERAEPMDAPTVAAISHRVTLPTRRWTDEEIEADYAEGTRRLATGDVEGWRDTLGRVMVNRPDIFVEQRYGGNVEDAVKALARFAVTWSERARAALRTRPETLETEVQAFRIGELALVANPAELFSTFALSVRSRCAFEDLMIVGYANDRIGYVPDAQDIAARRYGSVQSPKFCNQFPFTEQTGEVLADAMVETLAAVTGPTGSTDSNP